MCNKRKLSNTEIKQTELSLLRSFVKLCDDNGLYYTLCGGTLLGAVRHKGFIPWDDDIDVLMPRPDYDRLINEEGLDKTSLPDYCSLVSWKNRKSDYPFIKLVDMRTEIDIPYLGEAFKAKQIWIDIFPVDGNSENDQEQKKLFKRAIFWRKLVCLKSANPNAGKTRLHRMLKPLLVWVVSHMDLYRLCKKLDDISKTFPFDQSRLIGGVLWGYGPQERIDKSEYLKPINIEFEGEHFNAPSNYDEYLSGLYGDYMQLPPEDKRVTHEMIAYIRED